MRSDIQRAAQKFVRHGLDSAPHLWKKYLQGRLKIAGFLLGLFLLWQVVDLLPRFFFNAKVFQAVLDQQLDQSRLAVSYQGIDVSFFRGIRIIGVRVSFDRDFSRGRYFIEAPFAYIRTPLRFFTGESRDFLTNARIILEGATLNYWVTSDQGDKELLAQVRGILQQNQRYHVECNNCRFFLNVKDNSYFKEVTPIQKLYFTLRHDGKEIQSLVRYESSLVGNGDFFGKFAACDTALCDDLEGYWYFKPTGLKLAVFNNFQKDFNISGGLASGEVAFDRKINRIQKKSGGKEITQSEPISNFRMAVASTDLAIRRKKQEWYHAEALAIDTKLLIRGPSSTGFANVTLDSYALQVEFEDLRGDALPEKYLFSIKPKKFGKKILELPAQVTLSGLENFTIQLAERRGAKYAKTEVNMEIADGSLSLGKSGQLAPLKIPTLKMDLNNEKLLGNLALRTGNSSLTAAPSGYLELYPVQFRPLADALLRESEDTLERKIFSLRGKVACPLIAENIFWADVKPYVNAWLDDYWEQVESGIQYSWLPSHLLRREYFVRFIQYLDFYMPIEIKNFDWGRQIPLKGSLFFSPAYFGGGFKLETPDGSSSSQLSIAFVGGDSPYAPYMTHTLKLNLPESFDLLTPWFGRDYFEYFSTAEIVHSNNFNGERPADHYLKSMSVTDMRLKRVRFGAWARVQNLPLQWETVDIRANRGNGFGYVTSIRAENDNTLLSGYGDYKLFDRQIETNLKYSMITK